MLPRLAVFDFDLTLSTVHLFHALAGTSPSPLGTAPYAKGERGQLARLAELEASGHARNQGGFGQAVLGGPERVSQLRALLHELTTAGVECVVCTRGLIGPVKKCLELSGLLQYLSDVWGNIGDINGVTEYDQSVQLWQLGADIGLLGSPEMSMETFSRSKQKVIAHIMQERGLGFSDVIFIDDTAEEINQVAGTCLTMQVKSQCGMGQPEFELLRGILASASSSSSLSAKPGATSMEVVPTPLRKVRGGKQADKVQTLPSSSMLPSTTPAAVHGPASIWSLPMPKLPVRSDIAFTSILPPQLVELGEQQLREEYRQQIHETLKAGSADLAPRTTHENHVCKPLASLQLNSARIANPAKDVSYPWCCDSAPRSQPSNMQSTSNLSNSASDYSQQKTDRAFGCEFNEWPSLRAKPILVMDGCGEDGCGSLRRCERPSRTDVSHDGFTTSRSNQSAFRLESEDGRVRRQNDSDGFSIGCCSQ